MSVGPIIVYRNHKTLLKYSTKIHKKLCIVFTSLWVLQKMLKSDIKRTAGLQKRKMSVLIWIWQKSWCTVRLLNIGGLFLVPGKDLCQLIIFSSFRIKVAVEAWVIQESENFILFRPKVAFTYKKIKNLLFFIWIWKTADEEVQSLEMTAKSSCPCPSCPQFSWLKIPWKFPYLLNIKKVAKHISRGAQRTEFPGLNIWCPLVSKQMSQGSP